MDFLEPYIVEGQYRSQSAQRLLRFFGDKTKDRNDVGENQAKKERWRFVLAGLRCTRVKQGEQQRQQQQSGQGLAVSDRQHQLE